MLMVNRVQLVLRVLKDFRVFKVSKEILANEALRVF